MDKRALAAAFRERFRQLLTDVQDDIPGFLVRSGLDRSALSQLRDPDHDRLPRAETLRRIAEATGCSIDWLLGLDNAREGRQHLTETHELLAGDDPVSGSALSRWHSEASGHKLRYVPAGLPDMLNLAARDGAFGPPAVPSEDNVLTGFDLDTVDLEIAMPIQTLRALAKREGYFIDYSPLASASQLDHIAALCDKYYPAIRLHLFDGARHYSAPFTVFGRMRAAVYLGQAYFSVTGPDEVRYFTKKFDNLVRNAVVMPSELRLAIEDMKGAAERSG